MNKIKIVPLGARSYQVEIDGVAIGRGCESLHLDIVGGNVAEVTLKYSGLVEIPEELEALVTIEKKVEAESEASN